jgi:SAM-dependent methyltransferase
LDCCDERTPESLVARLAGYDPEDLSGLPGDAVRGASGCGTPVAFSDLLPGEVVLDLGSGAGLDLLLASRKVGPKGRVIGVDWDDALIERARSSVSVAGFANIEVRRGSSEDLPVVDGSVDWVISNRAISRCPDKAKVFAEIHRVLKPGGRVCIADIVAEGIPEWVSECDSPGTAWAVGAMSERSYVAGLAEAGLTVVRDGGRYVFEASELAAMADFGGCGEGVEAAAAEFTKETVGGVWSAYFFARKPLRAVEVMRNNEHEDSR